MAAQNNTRVSVSALPDFSGKNKFLVAEKKGSGKTQVRQLSR